MIALDTSAIVAIACREPESDRFNALIATQEAFVGSPTLLEARMVLERNIPDFADAFFTSFLATQVIHPVAFTLEMFAAAAAAFREYGKGRGHPAQLNFGDCLSYAVAKVEEVPLLYKGADFARTDIAAAAA